MYFLVKKNVVIVEYMTFDLKKKKKNCQSKNVLEIQL